MPFCLCAHVGFMGWIRVCVVGRSEWVDFSRVYGVVLGGGGVGRC